MLMSLQKFISYWYFRYLLVTELYMVEKWERAMIYMVFFIFFLCLSLFNNWVILLAVDAVAKNYQDWVVLPQLEFLQSIV